MRIVSRVLLMLSVTAGPPSLFHSKGPCPQTLQPSERLHFSDGQPITFTPYWHFNSEPTLDKSLGAVADNNNCLKMHMNVANDSARVRVDDCESFEGRAQLRNGSYYTLKLESTRTGHGRSEALSMDQLYIWTDAVEGMLVFYNCQNDSQATSHRFVVNVFIGQPSHTVDGYERPRNMTLFEEVARQKLKQAGVPAQGFDFYNRTARNTSTDCCDRRVKGRDISVGPVAILIFVCFICLLLCLIFM